MATSKNQRAEKIVWFRKIVPNAIIIDEPAELWYVCPVCKNKAIIPTMNWQWFDERLTRSEYNGFLWCSVCDKDYPACLCMPDIDRAIEIYLDIIENQKKIAEYELLMSRDSLE